MLRTSEMPFLSFKFQKFSGGGTPPDSPSYVGPRILLQSDFKLDLPLRMAYICSPEQSKSFWQGQKSYLVFHYPNILEKIQNYTTSPENCKEREQREKNDYLAEHTFLPVHQNRAGVNQISKTCADIRFWANYRSWKFRSAGNSISPKILPHNFSDPRTTILKRVYVLSHATLSHCIRTSQALCYH